jgi:hypothetical protein
MNRIIAAMSMTLALFLAGCPGGSESGEGCANGGNTNLGWALNIAHGVRDSELPGARLVEILGFPDVSGRITKEEPTNDWSFYYFRGTDPDYEYLAVTVYCDGTTFSFDPGGAITFTGIPDYTDAAGWIAQADQETQGLSFYYRAVQVFADEDDGYPTADTVAFVSYDDEGYDKVAYVVFDADTSDLLDVELNP